MAKGSSFAGDVIAYVFEGTAMPSYGATLYISLHSASPGAAGTQSTNEVSYTSYARQPVTVGSGWTSSGGNTLNAAQIGFPAATGGTATVTHFGIGTSVSGAGTLLYFGAFAAPLAVSTGVQPVVPISGLSVTES